MKSFKNSQNGVSAITHYDHSITPFKSGDTTVFEKLAVVFEILSGLM